MGGVLLVGLAGRVKRTDAADGGGFGVEFWCWGCG